MRLRKILYSALLLLVVAATACAKGDKGARGYVIGFYNVENLFDTYHDEGKNDYEYLPDGQTAGLMRGTTASSATSPR